MKPEFDPVVELMAKRLINKRKHRFWSSNPDMVRNQLKRMRREFLGSDLKMMPFVRNADGTPNYKNIELLSTYLSQLTEYYLKDKANGSSYGFYYYGFMIHANYLVRDEGFDNLLTLAECYEGNPDAYEIVLRDNLPEDMIPEFDTWYDVNRCDTHQFSMSVLGALSVFLGVMPTPKHFKFESE